MRVWKILAALTVLSACMAPPGAVTMGNGPADALPPIAADVLPVTSASALRPQRTNAEMAVDFLDLEFQMESGRRLPRLTRFDGPVTVGFAGPAPATAQADLEALIARIRSEAGVDLSLAAPGQAPSIAIVFSTHAALRKIVPSAACFVVPGASSLAEYEASRGSAATDWSRMTRRSRALVLIPADTAPQEIRDCLHEEVAQALGPLNDLYRLPDSVFNDDNFQSVLTGFDMLMLRVHYAPELANGMAEPEVAARLPGILARMNPAGASGPLPVPRDTPRAWLGLMATALGPPDGGTSARLDAAKQASAMAEARGWQDNRLGLAWFALGRAEVALDPAAARAAYQQAHAIYSRLPDGGVHAAHVAMQLAALELGRGDLDAAMGWIGSAGPALPLAQNPALDATLWLIEAEIDSLRGEAAQAQALRLDSAAAARYGFGAERLDARTAEIARLAVKGQAGQ
jgi:hypothetical protein